MNNRSEKDDYLAIYHSNDNTLDLGTKDQVEIFDCLPDPDPYYNDKTYAIFRFNANDSDATINQTQYTMSSGLIYRV